MTRVDIQRRHVLNWQNYEYATTQRRILQCTVSHAIGITVTVRVAILCWQNGLTRNPVTRIEPGYKLFCLLQLSSPQNLCCIWETSCLQKIRVKTILFLTLCVLLAAWLLWVSGFYKGEDCRFSYNLRDQINDN